MSVQLPNLLKERSDVNCDEVWENECTPGPVRVFGGLHSMGLSLRDVEPVLERPGVDRCFQALWNWTHTLSESQEDSPTAAK